MRPLRLEFHAFGSFPGRHVVDFDALGRRGLFVVAGPTGAGKTTIFDAMVYALYGRLPGGRAAEGEPRSHHADPDSETYVVLDFEVDGVRHRVRRTPKWERRKQRGSGTTTQQPTAMVGRVEGDDLHGAITQLSQVNAECERLVGLDFVQFQRVVLLPQGKFNDVLVASDETREVLLRQLFGGDLYERALAVLKQRAATLDTEVGAVDEQVRHHRTNAVGALLEALQHWPLAVGDLAAPAPAAASTDEWAGTLFDLPAEAPVAAAPTPDADAPIDADHLHLATEDELLQVIVLLDERREAERAAVDTARQAAVQATTLAGEMAAAAQRWADAAGHRATLAQLAATADAVEAGRAAVAASRRARPVVQAAEANARAAAAAVEAQVTLDRFQAEVAAQFDAISRPMPVFDPATVAAAVTQASAEVEARAEQLRARHAADQAATAAQRRAVDADAAVARVAEHLEALRDDERTLVTFIDEWRPVADERVVRQVALTTAEQHCATRRRHDDEIAAAERFEAEAEQVREHYHEVLRRYLAAHAPRLAAQLQDGEPCPVCGSCEHPHPAQHTAETIVIDHDQVDEARGRWTACTATAAAHRATAASLLESLGDLADATPDDLEAQRVAASQALIHAQQAHQKVGEAEAHLVAVRVALDEALATQAGVATALATAQAEADMAARQLAQLQEATEGIDADQVERHQAVLRTLRDATAGMAAAFDAVTAAQATAATTAAALDAALDERGFAQLDGAAAALLDVAEEDQLEVAADEWQALHADASSRLQQLIEQGVPDQAPDTESARRIADELEAAATAATARWTTAAGALDRARTAVEQVAELAASSADLRAQRDVARVVYRTCNGDNAVKVKLERWVLGAELDRVTAAANEHLARMTAHRYRLHRPTGAGGGLGLSVIDSHTGRTRPTQTLSGGEQFQASLALALGLADVVGHGGTASGRQFEALFVDEGFGSLDPDSLDDAIGALTMLQAAGRMVGAITHVEVMQQRLHVGIEVTPLPGGRGSTLTVHP